MIIKVNNTSEYFETKQDAIDAHNLAIEISNNWSFAKSVIENAIAEYNAHLESGLSHRHDLAHYIMLALTDYMHMNLEL